MSNRRFDTIIMVDWSARSQPDPEKPTGDAVWLVVAGSEGAENPRCLRTRSDALGYLTDLLVKESGRGRRVLVGFDFPFGYPDGVAERICGKANAPALWDWFATHVQDSGGNASNHFDAASRRIGHPPERRQVDERAKGAKTGRQLTDAGFVGSQVIAGLPALTTIRAHPDLQGKVKVWPFETGFTAGSGAGGGVILAEIYPSLLRDAISTAGQNGEVPDATQVRVLAEAFTELDRAGQLVKLFSVPPALDRESQAIVRQEEGWILGVGAENAMANAVVSATPEGTAPPPVPLPKPPPAPATNTLGKRAPLHYKRDPAAIYAESFATVKREARLVRFPPGMDRLATRVIHACGMVEVADRLSFSRGAFEAGQRALAAGAPVLCDCEMVAAGVIRRLLPAANPVVVTLNDPRVPGIARDIGNTRSAAAVELWRPILDGAVVAIGNAPTALFHLLELIDAGAPRPALILGFPVGFVGAAESKAELAARPRDCDFVALRGRRGGSAMASAAVNALSAPNGEATP